MYDFTGRPASAKSLVHPIVQLGDEVVGVELGVFEATNFCFLLQACKNIKTLHGVDAYKPYEDRVYGGQVIDKSKIESINMTAFHNIRFSGEAARAKIHVMSTLEAVGLFDDASVDFIFQDAYLSYEQAMQELKAWYPKLKTGGIYSGHDYNDPQVTRAVKDFRESEGIDARMSVWDDVWMWFKK